MLVADAFGLRAEPYFELGPAVRAAGPPSVDLSGQG